ncbi:MAG: hypothetical protein ACOC7J_01320 [Armatimonadota bacterium]
MLMKRSFLILITVAMTLGPLAAAIAADISEEDVLLKTELESWGRTAGLSPVGYPEASGGVAMAMSADAVAVDALHLEAGEYSLVLWQHGPAPDADGFFVEIAGERTRLLGTNDSWGTLALPFTVQETGSVAIAIIGQEPRMTIDRIAVVRGSYDQRRDSPVEIEFADIPGETAGERIGLDEVERLATPARLSDAPTSPLDADASTVLQEDFEDECHVVGEHHWTDGPFGRALVLEMPDGRFDIDATELEIGEQGTIEWWVKTREAARVWWDQGWHYFLHLSPAEPGGAQLDLDKHVGSLSLTVTPDGDPYERNDGECERAQFNAAGLSNEDWHHLLVSWDLRGDRQFVWVMVDGRGTEMFFPRTFEPTGFARVEFGNTPSEWDIPHLPMDGAIDAIRISNVSVADRLAQ